MSTSIKAVLLVAAILSLFLAFAPTSHAALSAVGLVDPATTFPAWYQDPTGLSLAPCFDNNGFCSITMVEQPGFTPALPIAFPLNFPGEGFYFMAQANFADPIMLYIAALEFAGNTPGTQITFARLMIRNRNVLAGTITVTHPYGFDTINADPARGINFTEDIGLAPGIFTGALAGRIGPFLRSAGGLVTSPDGNVYIGNSVTPVAVTGTPVTSVTVAGPISATTNTFILEGKVIGMSVTPTSITFPVQRPLVDSAPVTVTVTNLFAVNNLTLAPIVPQGTNSADFRVVDVNCLTAPIDPVGSCTFNVIFNGAAAGSATRTATVVVTATTPASTPPARVNLIGTIDAIPPTVVSTFPADGQTVPANIITTAVFSEPMAAVSINNTSFTVVGSGGAVSGNVTLDSVNNTASFIPIATLASNQLFTATVTTGATDVAGNPLVANKTWAFTTGIPDITPPTIVAANPAANAVGVPVNSPVKVTFSEQMNAASINATTFTVSGGVTGTVTYDAGTNTATFTPSASLAPGTPYTVTIKGGPGGVGDLALNTLANDFQWTFLTNHPPSVPGLVSPADGTSGLLSTVTLTWTKATDDDGDTLSYQVFLCNNQFFIGCNAVVVTASAPRVSAVYFTGLGGLGMAVFGLAAIGGIKNRKRIMLVLAITMMTGALIYSCGGSGDSGGDTTPPTIPAGVTATAVSASQINLAWLASSDNVGVSGYTIFSGSISLTSVTTATSISVTGLSPSTNYCYSVNAHDAAGNESAQSDPACATTESGVIAPSNELSFTATGLNPNTSYFWKVAANDGKGGVTFSETRSFQTQ